MFNTFIAKNELKTFMLENRLPSCMSVAGMGSISSDLLLFLFLFKTSHIAPYSGAEVGPWVRPIKYDVIIIINVRRRTVTS